ncbi:MAG: hypothetical protein AAB326_00060 [Pseudomonadota bacterium]
MSTDHKEKWLDSNINLFWDINNIAFSHMKCNTSAVNLGKIGTGNSRPGWHHSKKTKKI